MSVSIYRLVTLNVCNNEGDAKRFEIINRGMDFSPGFDRMRKLEIIIVGAGTGGLCLAHGLRDAGVNVRVFERDRGPTDPMLGYRLTINAGGARALRSCLPTVNFERYVAASAKISTAVTFLDHKLRRLLTIGLPQTDQSAPEAARPISRVALRQILLDGLEGVVSFGKTFTAFEMTVTEGVSPQQQDPGGSRSASRAPRQE